MKRWLLARPGSAPSGPGEPQRARCCWLHRRARFFRAEERNRAAYAKIAADCARLGTDAVAAQNAAENLGSADSRSWQAGRSMFLLMTGSPEWDNSGRTESSGSRDLSEEYGLCRNWVSMLQVYDRGPPGAARPGPARVQPPRSRS